MAQVNVSVDESTKDQWEDYIKETGEYGTLSALVRTAVQREISEEESNTVPTEILNLADDVQEIKETVAEIEDRLGWVEEDIPAESIKELADDLLNIMQPLPAGEADTEQGGAIGKKQAAINVIQQGDGPQTAEVLAEKVDSTEKRVEKGLTHLRQQFLIDDVEIEGETHYFRVD